MVKKDKNNKIISFFDVKEKADMFVNSYDFELENEKNEKVAVSLRLGAGCQLKLKRKWDEGTTETLFNAVDDVERFIDVLDFSLNFTGNTNTIKKGEELYDLMAMNEMLGMAEKQKLITAIGRVSGIFSEKEKNAIDKRSEKLMGNLYADDDEKGKKASKNA